MKFHARVVEWGSKRIYYLRTAYSETRNSRLDYNRVSDHVERSAMNWMTELLRKLQIPWSGTQRRHHRRYARPRLEMLENRLAPAAHDTLSSALALTFNPSQQAQATSTLVAPAQVDLYALQLQAGNEIAADVRAQSLNSPASCLRIFDGSGHQLAFQENSGGLDTNQTFDAMTTGTYYLGVSSNGNYSYDPNTADSGSGGLSSGAYTLTLHLSSILVSENSAAGTPSNIAFSAAQAVTGKTVLQGKNVSGSEEYYSFTATGTGGLTATVTPANGSAYLPRLMLYNADKQLLVQSDAADASHDSAQLNQNLQPGEYYLVVAAATDLGTSPGDQSYVLTTAFDQALPPFQKMPVGNLPDAVAVGDFNHDGNLDVVTANAGDNTVSVLQGNGDGTFRSASTFNVGLAPSSVAVGDFNHDGNLDLVTANYKDNTVSVLLGKGDGTFGSAVFCSVGQEPSSVAVGDFNKDGNLDLVTANYQDNTVSVLQGKGDGTFESVVICNVGPEPTSVAVGDFDSDGHLDIVTASALSGDNLVSVLRGNGDGTFQQAQNYDVAGGPTGIAVGNFNGHLGVVTASTRDQTVSVFLGVGDGTFQPAATYTVGAGVAGVAVGDFNHDGHLDIVTANKADNTVSVLLARDDGTFLSPPTYNVGTGPFTVALGDFSNNGNTDIVTAINANKSALSVLIGNGDGTFQSPVTYDVGSSPIGVAVGKFTSDGNLDLVSANSGLLSASSNDYGPGSVSVLLGRGDGTFLPAVNYAVGLGPFGVAVGDFNGHLDIVTANNGDDTISVLLGNGDGTFQPAVTYKVGSKPIGVAVGNFNGHLGIVTANSALDRVKGPLGIGTVSVLLGNGDGTFQSAVNYDVGYAPYGVAVGDFNGHVGIVAANNFSNSVSVLLGCGDGTFLSATTLQVGNAPISVTVGNFNGHDGIVSANSAYNLFTNTYGVGSVSVLLGNGDGTFQPTISHTVASGPFGVAVADLNHDGQLDIVTANLGDNTDSVLLGEGNGQFQTSTPQNGIAIQHIPVLQDLTGDNLPDSLILNRSGDLLFRQGLSGAPGQFASPTIINPGHPARDFTLFQTADGWAVAAIDQAGNTVSIYTWDAVSQSFLRTDGFATGNLPVRIAAADLNGQDSNGHHLDDLVVANDFDNSVAIAFQTASGKFDDLTTRPLGVGPSQIVFADLGGANGLDIVISDQVSGDFTILFNDPTHSFSREARYRAGAGLFDIDNSAAGSTVLSQLQTVGIVAGDFTGANSDDLVVLNRNARSFALLRNLGQGRFVAPQSGDLYFPTSNQPVQLTTVTLPGDALPSVAILMADLGEIWIYRNEGAGVFAPPLKIKAGNDPSGFSVATVNGKLALLVGNAFGDILTLLYDGHGGFAPDRANLQSAPLAVGTIASTGQQFVVVADQGVDRVSVYYRIAGTDQFGSPVLLTGTNQKPILAPGAVQIFNVVGDPHPYLIVANSLGNNLLVYHSDPITGQFELLTSYPVGFDPVSITVADVNGDGVPDLLVANQGSNDVSVLIGNMSTGVWTATPYQRLNSGGSGPIAVYLRNTGGANGPDLVIANSDGTLALLPGIGSGGKGSGFFQDTNPRTVIVANGAGMTAPSFAVNSNIGLAVTGDGSIVAINLDTFTANVVFQAWDGFEVRALDTVAEGEAVAAFSDGNVAELLASSSSNQLSVASLFAPLTGKLTDPSDLAVSGAGASLLAFATNVGSSELIVLAPVSSTPTRTDVTVSQDASLALIVTVLTGGESIPEQTSVNRRGNTADDSAAHNGTAAATAQAAKVGSGGGDDSPGAESGSDSPPPQKGAIVDTGYDVDSELRQFDLYPRKPETDPGESSSSHRDASSSLPSTPCVAERQDAVDELFRSWPDELAALPILHAFEQSAADDQPSTERFVWEALAIHDQDGSPLVATTEEADLPAKGASDLTAISYADKEEVDEFATRLCQGANVDLERSVLVSLAVMGLFYRQQDNDRRSSPRNFSTTSGERVASAP